MELQSILERVCAKNGWTLLAEMIEIELTAGRTQKIWRQSFEHDGESMVRFCSVVGSAESITETRLRAALSLNFGLPHGALAMHREELVLVDTFLVRDADESELQASLQSLAVTADQYERQLFGTDHH